MEEEIIVPEEETFNYDIMRYDLDELGYVSSVYFGCFSGTCKGYEGDIPEGYETLIEWSENANIRAYKIVDGNLVYDPNRDEILKAQFEKEEEDNRCVRYKEISNITNIVKTDSVDAYKRSTTDLLNILEVTDSNKFASEYIKLIANEDIIGSTTIKFNNGNLLTNDATSKQESGISFAVNADRSISLSGTATEDVEFNIGGTNTSTKTILAFKKNTDYYLSSNGYQIKMYYYDGIDRTEVYNGTGGVINLSANTKITNIVLAIPNGTTANETIYPMLNLGTTANDYVTYEGNETTIYLEDKTFKTDDEIEIESGEVKLGEIQFPSINKDAAEGLTPSLTLTPSETLEPSTYHKTLEAIYPSENTYAGYKTLYYLDDCIMPYTYLDKTYMYVYDDIDLMVTYPNTERDLDLCGYETPNKGFAVDEEGNMYCNNATIRGSAIVNGSNFKVDEEGNLICNDGTMNNINVNGGKIILSDDGLDTNPAIQITTTSDIGYNEKTKISGSGFYNELDFGGDKYHIEIAGSYIFLAGNGNHTSISEKGISTPKVTQTSLEENKKNFEIFNNALGEIKKTDIYKYNLKDEEDGYKKHIGFVIGESYNYSSEITAIDENGKEIGVDTYSMTSLCLQAIKEQQAIIEKLEERIKSLEDQKGE